MIVDTHVHVIDPARFPPPPSPGLPPLGADEASAAQLEALFARQGVTNAVLVQLSGYGLDNACILDAAARSKGRWRAVVQVDPEIGDTALDALVEAGAVGVRFNIGSLGPRVLDGCDRLFAAMAERGMLAQIHCEAKDLPEIAPLLKDAPRPLLFDHLGRFEPRAGLADGGFARLLHFGREGALIKLSGAFRVSREGFPHRDLDPYVEALLAAFPPQNRVFGSDFPFVKLAARPRYEETLAMARRWLPDPAEREMALAHNSRRIFRFA
jgi:predicted TIM-barrel fold metal-dependent hydrolase